ncbi:inositol monophosphatase family protein [Bacillus tianshenii]|nr:inositol monophosphatase family protein [Bacillus tianshenii]
MDKYEGILDNIKKWVREAGEEQLRRFELPMNIEEKSAEIDLVTEVDVWTEEYLLDKIKSTYPDHAILSEESGQFGGKADVEWVIDPIDGTTNFAHGIPLYCISVAVKYKGEAVIGVVYVPRLNEMFEAIKGEGAFLNGKQIDVSTVENERKAVVATGFPYDRAKHPNNNVDNFNAVVTNVGGVRRTGSAAIDLSFVAAGRFDAYWELKVKPWDVEAGLLLITEAGGKIHRLENEQGTFVVVGNPYMYEWLKERVRP